MSGQKGLYSVIKWGMVTLKQLGGIFTMAGLSLQHQHPQLSNKLPRDFPHWLCKGLFPLFDFQATSNNNARTKDYLILKKSTPRLFNKINTEMEHLHHLFFLDNYLDRVK